MFNFRCAPLAPRFPSLDGCHECVLTVMEKHGEPPAGAYFWPQKVAGGEFEVVLCYDEENREHKAYVEAVGERKGRCLAALFAEGPIRKGEVK